MDITKLTRDAAKVHAYLRELPDGRLVTTKGVKIQIPSRFAEHSLAEIGAETHILGICAFLVDDKYYGTMMVDAMLRIEPTSTIRTMVNEDEYFEFYFEPGSTVISSLDLIRTDTIVYRIYHEFIASGRAPWYTSYLDLGGLFETAREHAGANIGQDPEKTELLISMIARSEEDRHKYYRQVIKSMVELLKNPPVIIPLRSVTYSATNTTNKLLGNHFDEGITSALVSPSERVEPIEDILRR